MKTEAAFRPMPTHESPILREQQQVTSQARSRLERSAYYALKRIACDFHEGVLTLRGRVPSFYLKQLAQALLVGLDHVEVLVNHVEVA